MHFPPVVILTNPGLQKHPSTQLAVQNLGGLLTFSQVIRHPVPHVLYSSLIGQLSAICVLKEVKRGYYLGLF